MNVFPLGREKSIFSKDRKPLLALLLLAVFTASALHAQTTQETGDGASSQQSTQTNADLQHQVDQLRQLLLRLEQRIDILEKQNGEAVEIAPKTAVLTEPSNQSAGTSEKQSLPALGLPPTTPPMSQAPFQTAQNDKATDTAQTPATTAAAPVELPSFLGGTTLNFTLDGYYEYNFNRPVGQQNQLRAYDLSSNSFSLNQADIILDHPADAAHGKRIGGRLDIMFGQATETLQGNANNELHPSIWRNVFQAYGTYVAPIGSGLNIDFGKWASALGVEGNYTKDQINYTRSYFFDFLPFYHMGFRTSYTFNPKLTAGYWLVNGAQQTDAFSGFKSQNFALTLHPVSCVSWQINYFFGQQQRSFTLSGNPDTTQTATAITPTPNGREHIFDSYATWNANSKLTLVGEGDFVINRIYSESAPQHVAGGAAYINYQWTPKFALAGRAEYLADPQGLFSGTSQALKESTVTADYLLANGFKVFTEWRRDFSNQPYFHTATAGNLVPQQTTATMGLVWWFGQMPGPW